MGKRSKQEAAGLLAEGEPLEPRKKRKSDPKRASKEEELSAGGSEPATTEAGCGGKAGGPAAAEPANGTSGAAEAPLDAEDGAAGNVPKTDKPKIGKAAPVLPWMRVPIAIEASDGILLDEVQGLDPRLKAALEGSGIEVLFPVQTVVWHETAGGSSAAHDVCICAPTGSGKTLAYSLPLLQALAGRAVRRVRALIVLPTRDLAVQVYTVLAGLCPALGLTACLACGRASLAAEAEVLSSGAVDVVVATPGRLISHLEGTPGFSLVHLRFLVVDETDRLLRQSYQDWLPKVMAALGQQQYHVQQQYQQYHVQQQQQQQQGQGQGQQPPVAGSRGASAFGAAAALAPAPPAAASQALQQQRVVKFVVSATLTRDPSKIDRLGLHCPRYIAMSAVDHRHKLPRSLREYKAVVPAEQKPLALAALLRTLGLQPTIVFTSSVEATHRLHLMLRACEGLPGRAVEFSSLLRPEERRSSLEAFRSGAAQVLVCSDAMTRGMDLAGVAVVINYDAPVYVKTYVHRAGRTARAGRTGAVYTLLRHEDVRHFKDMLRKADNTYVKDVRLERAEMEAARPAVEAALEAMREALAAEAEAAAAAAAAGAAAGTAGGAQQTGRAVQKPSNATAAAANEQAAQKRKVRKRRLAGVQEFRLG